MEFYKKREDANYLLDGYLKYLFTEEIIRDFCEDKYDIKESRINFPAVYIGLGGKYYPFNKNKDINPNVIIYKRTYYEPTKNGFKRDYKIRETVEIMAYVGSDTWLRLHSSKGHIIGLDNVFKSITDDLMFDYVHNNLKSVTSLSTYAITVPDIDLVTTDLIPKLIENKIEII